MDVKEFSNNIEHTVKKASKKVTDMFHTDDVFKDSEVAGNRLVGKTMFNMAVVLFVCLVLNYYGIFELTRDVLNVSMVWGIVELVIPALICQVFKGDKPWLKYLMVFELAVVVTRLYGVLTFDGIVFLVLPSILSVRYYSQKFTSTISAITSALFILASYVSARFNTGQLDLNYYPLPKGTVITIESTLHSAIEAMGIDAAGRTYYYMTLSVVPKLLCLSVVFIVCSEVAKVGHNMVLRQAEISAEGARIESELNLAKEIQTGLLPCIFPAFPENEEVDVFATMTPAKEVGGDFYDYFRIDKDHIAIVIADVSGKGVPAALFMMISKTMLKNETQSGLDPAAVFEKVNNQLCDGNEVDLFVTAWLGIYEISTGKLRYANAGHNPPLLRRCGGKFEYLKGSHGLVLAAIEDMEYSTNELTLNVGDTLYLYTDGVTEATDTENNLYGEERLKNYLDENCVGNVQDILKGVKNDIDRFAGDAQQFDDITMLIMRIENEK